MFSHLTLQLESMDGPEKKRTHLSIRGGAHDTSASHSPKSVYSHLTLSSYHTGLYLLGSGPGEPLQRGLLYRIQDRPQPGL